MYFGGRLLNFNSMVRDEVDGSRVAQINLLRIAKGNEDPNRIHLFRCDNNLPDLKTFNDNCAQLEVPNRSNTNYMPYDISDELELRNRFLLDVNDSNSRLESAVQKTLRFYWGNPYRHRFVPIDTLADLDAWKIMLSAYDIDLNLYRTNAYDFRHLLTTYDLDTTYNPMNRRQQYVNDVNLADLYYNDFNSCVDPCASVAVVQGLKADLAQIAVNIKDYGDSDNIVSVLNVNIDGTGERTFYGFETPCIYISELSFAFRSADRNTPGDTDQVAFAIELFKRYGDDTFGDDFEIVVTAGPNNVERRFRIDGSSFATRGSKFYVKVFESDITKPLLRDKVMFSDTPENGATGVDPRVLLGWDKSWQDKDPTKPWQYDIYFGTDPNNVRDANTTNGLGVYIGRNPSRSFDPNPTGDLDTSETYYWRIDDVDSTGKVIGKGEIWHFTTADKIPTPDVDSTISYSDMVFDEGTRIDLNRDTAAGPVCVDTVTIPRGLILKSTDLSTGISLTRDIRENWCIKKLWSPEPTVMSAGNSSLGNSWDQFQSTDPETIEAHPRRFDNVGDVCKVFRVNAYNLGPTSTERSSMIDLTEPNMQRIFNYITGLNDQLFDKAKTKVKGRINVNTAPWYVIAQLPWVSPELARTIVAYRDKTDIEAAGVGIFYSNGRGNVTGIPGLREAPGFASIGELANVINRDETMPGNSPYSMHRYGIDGVDQLGFPDLTFNSRTRTDGAKDNQEELNLIFARISDLVTVRSDLFTAYILVRLGETGPQKRVIAILDRSDRKNVKVVARYPVPDPR